MKRKPRKKRPKHIKIDGYDSIWEFILHDTLLKEWEHHSEKVEHTVKHTYELNAATVSGLVLTDLLGTQKIPYLISGLT